MKKIVFILCVLSTIHFAANCQKKFDNSGPYDLSTPEKSWQALLSELKTGMTDSVKSVVTKKGFDNLIKYISPSNESEPFASTFKTWGNMWAGWEIKWGQVHADKVELTLGPAVKEHVFTFLNAGTQWKMDSWFPGE